jgi:HJR/Mrr/RecB family endonuclease
MSGTYSTDDSEILEELRSYSPTEFEEFVADLWSARGWDVRRTKQTGDKGIDVIAKKGDTTLGLC